MNTFSRILMAALLSGPAMYAQQPQTPSTPQAPAGCAAAAQPPTAVEKHSRFHIPRAVQKEIDKQRAKLSDKAGIDLDDPNAMVRDAQKAQPPRPCPAQAAVSAPKQ